MLPSIATRRHELKQTRRALTRSIQKLRDELTRIENTICLGIKYKSIASDQRGRRAELDLAIREDKNHSILQGELRDAEDELEDVEDLISTVNFRQRERLILQLSQLDSTTEKLTKSIDKFDQAVDKFAEVRNKTK